MHEILNYYYQTWIYRSGRSLRESRPRALNIGPGRAAGSKFSVVSNVKKNEDLEDSFFFEVKIGFLTHKRRINTISQLTGTRRT